MAVDRMIAHLRAASRKAAERIKPYLPALTSAHAGSISGLMRMIDERFGSIEGYARHIGVDGSMARLRENLLVN